MEIAFVNGQFMPLGEAVISIEDRGFQFADGVYEVLATHHGKPYAMEQHFERLERSLEALRLDLDIRSYGLEKLMRCGIEQCAYSEVLVYIQVTRGGAPRYHEFPAARTKPTVVMTFKELRRPADEDYQRGVRVITTPDLRWKRCDIKTIALLPNILAKQEAAEAGAFEALLVDEKGRITEGSSTSAFCIHKGHLWTTPEGPHILPSITRAILLDLARQLRVPVKEEFSNLEEYLGADEVLLAGTTTEAMGVVRIDDVEIGEGKPGPITCQLRAAFLEKVKG